MIELKQDNLLFTFPEVHPDARLSIEFQRTLRIPDDGRTYPLPPGLGRFPLRHVDDHATNVPPRWLEHGGVLLPMYQSEALWLRFESGHVGDREASYPFAIKVATGKVCAVTGKSWSDGLAQQSAGLHGRSESTMARRLLRRQGQHPPVCRDAAWGRLHGRGADHQQGRTWRLADYRISDEKGDLREALSKNAARSCEGPYGRGIFACVIRHATMTAKWAWHPADSCTRKSTRILLA